jgi:two-component system, OmpR family, sensor kinase
MGCDRAEQPAAARALPPRARSGGQPARSRPAGSPAASGRTGTPWSWPGPAATRPGRWPPDPVAHGGGGHAQIGPDPAVAVTAGAGQQRQPDHVDRVPVAGRGEGGQQHVAHRAAGPPRPPRDAPTRGQAPHANPAESPAAAARPRPAQTSSAAARSRAACSSSRTTIRSCVSLHHRWTVAAGSTGGKGQVVLPPEPSQRPNASAGPTAGRSSAAA